MSESYESKEADIDETDELNTLVSSGLEDGKKKSFDMDNLSAAKSKGTTNTFRKCVVSMVFIPVVVLGIIWCTYGIYKQAVISNDGSVSEPGYVFPSWNGDFPCYLDEAGYYRGKFPNGGYNTKGIFFVRNGKAASSTLVGITHHIAMRHKDPEMNEDEKCLVQAHHHNAFELSYRYRDRTKSFLFTFIRDPAERILSEYFYHNVAGHGENATSASIKKALVKSRVQYTYLRTQSDEYYEEKNFTVAEMVEDILHDYDFIGLVERFDESLVIMRLLLGLDAKDILYVSGKKSGSYSRFGEKCKFVPHHYKTPEVEDYLESEEWKEKSKVDYALIEALESSYEATINSIGRKKFEKALKEHKKLLKKIELKCNDVYKCSDTGEPKQGDCLWGDIGCGNKCINLLI